jgi:hypothetical protein
MISCCRQEVSPRAIVRDDIQLLDVLSVLYRIHCVLVTCLTQLTTPRLTIASHCQTTICLVALTASI